MGLKSIVTPSETKTITMPVKTETVDRNPYMNIISNKYTGSNPIKRFFNRLAFKRELKKIKERSPSFGELWYFADFIKTAERVYFLNNTQKSSFYSSRSYKAGENGFTLDPEEFPITIVVKLYSDESKVIMDIKRTNGGNMVTEHVFINNDWTGDKTEYDEVLIDNIIGAINDCIIKLMKDCWSIAGFYNSIPIKL